MGLFYVAEKNIYKPIIKINQEISVDGLKIMVHNNYKNIADKIE